MVFQLFHMMVAGAIYNDVRTEFRGEDPNIDLIECEAYFVPTSRSTLKVLLGVKPNMPVLISVSRAFSYLW